MLHLAVFFNEDDIGVIVGDTHFGVGVSLVGGNNNIKDQGAVGNLDGDVRGLHKLLDLFLLVLGNVGNDFQLLLGVSGHNACGSGGGDSPKMSRIGDDYAFYVFDDVAAGLHNHPFR